MRLAALRQDLRPWQLAVIRLNNLYGRGDVVGFSYDDDNLTGAVVRRLGGTRGATDTARWRRVGRTVHFAGHQMTTPKDRIRYDGPRAIERKCR